MAEPVRLDRRGLGRFAAGFLAVFAVGLITFPLWASPYKRLLAGAANEIVGGFEPPVVIELLEDGTVRYVEHSAAGGRSRIVQFGERGLGFAGINALLLPSLLLATPFPWRRRLRSLALGLPLLFLLQLVVATLWAKVGACVADRPDSLFCDWMFHALGAAGQLGAVALWGALCWGDLVLARVAGGAPGRNAPCDCGSGRKHKHCCGRLTAARR